jgi:surface antigen
MMVKIFKRSALSATVLAAVVVMTGCAEMPLNNQDWGRILGAGGGAVLGSSVGGGSGNTIATVLGGVLGYVVGGNIGRNMDRTDQERAARLVHRGFEQPAGGVYRDSWRGRDGSRIESQVSTQPQYTENGRKCSQFKHETLVRIEGQRQPQPLIQRGVACQEYSPQYRQEMWVLQQ